jgi:hypothetical protein
MSSDIPTDALNAAVPADVADTAVADTAVPADAAVADTAVADDTNADSAIDIPNEYIVDCINVRAAIREELRDQLGPIREQLDAVAKQVELIAKQLG